MGHLPQFDDLLVDSMDVSIGFVRLPMALAFLLEATGAVALERCGAILDERIQAAGASGPGAGAIS